MVKNNIDKTEKSDEVVEDTVQKNEAKPNVESLNNNANEVSNNKESNVAEQANVNSTQEDFKIALKWGRSIRQYIYMECNKE